MSTSGAVLIDPPTFSPDPHEAAVPVPVGDGVEGADVVPGAGLVVTTLALGRDGVVPVGVAGVDGGSDVHPASTTAATAAAASAVRRLMATSSPRRARDVRRWRTSAPLSSIGRGRDMAG